MSPIPSSNVAVSPHPAVSPHASISTCDSFSPAEMRLRQRLLALPFPTFALTVADLLRCLGYEDVALRGITGGRNRNSHGGLDIEAFLTVGLTRSRVICQLRHYSHEPVPRSSVDVLRGAMLRTGAVQGLLVTTSSFAPSALEAAQSAQHLAPVRLIEGTELVRLLAHHHLLNDTSEREEAAVMKGVTPPSWVPAPRTVPLTVPSRPIPRTWPISPAESQAREADFLRALEQDQKEARRHSTPPSLPPARVCPAGGLEPQGSIRVTVIVGSLDGTPRRENGASNGATSKREENRQNDNPDCRNHSEGGTTEEGA